jgi:UDP-3-O-[3-hydroxymyristoyl] glucosamine N-acyltransferase
MIALKTLADALHIPYEGDDVALKGMATLKDAAPDELSVFHSEKYLDDLKSTRAAAVLLQEKYVAMLPKGVRALVTDEPYLKAAYASAYFAPKLSSKSEPPVTGEGCDIADDVRFGINVVIGDNVKVLPGCYIGDNVVIGEGTLIHPNVTIYHGTHIGKRCIIHSGTVIGSDGFGFAHTKTGEHIKFYQNGNVVIEDDVEIGANCTIDRATFGSTIIRCGSKLDNLIQIAHNCEIGAGSLLAAQVGLAGSTSLGHHVVMGGQSASAGHLHIGDIATIAGKAGVTKSLEGGKTYAGFPAVDIKIWRRLQAVLMRLVKSR